MSVSKQSYMINGKVYFKHQLRDVCEYIMDLVNEEFREDKPLGCDDWPYKLGEIMGLESDENGDYGLDWDDVALIVRKSMHLVLKG